LFLRFFFSLTSTSTSTSFLFSLFSLSLSNSRSFNLLGCWELVVLSKNGVLLNGVNLKPPEGEGNDDDEGEEGAGAKDKKRSQATSATAIARLASGDAISVGDREFLFLLPSKRAAVLTMEGVLEPGWLSGGVVASGKATATAIPAAAAAAAPAAAAAAALPVAV
jgi:hypothetical protein